MLTWDANDPNIIKVSGGSVNMYGQPGRTVITFTADGKSYDVAWVLGSDKLNVKDVLPTGVDYAWKAKVVGTDTALNNEDNGGTLLDHDRYKAPTPKPEPSEPSEPSKPSEPSDSDASTEGEAATRNDRPVASSVALSTVDGASKPWIPRPGLLRQMVKRTITAIANTTNHPHEQHNKQGATHEQRFR